MATFSATSLFFIMAITGCSLAEVLRIVRDSAFLNDDFLLPASQCPRYQPQCSKFKGTGLTICWCACDDIQSQTSAFFEPNYGCTLVRSVRQHAGCQLLFTGESADERLAFFPTDTVREKDVSVPANQRCSFFYGNQFHVQYLDCTGSWRSITTQNVLGNIELTPGWSTTHLKIRIKAGSAMFQNITAGRLVRVAIQCRHQTHNWVNFTSSCVLFQVHGAFECPYPQPTLSPGLTQATLPTPVKQRLNSTSTVLLVTTPAEKPTTSPIQEQSTTTGHTTKPSESTGTLPPDCHKPLGLADGRINKTQITANSVYRRNYTLYGPSRARLNRTGGYRAEPRRNDSSLTVNFEQPMIITGVATQGYLGGNVREWVKAYYLGYSFGSGTIFFKERNRDVAKQFQGNRDNNTIVRHYVPRPAMVKSVHIIPTEWENNFAIRLELYGCIADGNECESFPCQNNGSCWEKIRGYQCNCTAGFNGTHCKINIDDCASNPCQNNGSCVDLVNDFKCTGCMDGYTGKRCEIGPYPQPTLSPGFTQATFPTPVKQRLNSTSTVLPVTTPAEKPTTSPIQEQSTTTGHTNKPSESTGTLPPGIEEPLIALFSKNTPAETPMQRQA